MMQPEPMAKQSRAGSHDVVGAVDRLSTLPDGLIHTVLSFLPSPEVVQTCVLSRRWRNLWRSVPRINLDEEDFGISLMVGHGDAMEEKWARFEDFATNLLLFHDNTSSLGEFRLSSSAYNQLHVDRWIRRGIEYCPSVLNIQILACSRFTLSPVVDSNFHHLKTLHLCSVDLGSHFMGLLCSACPVMEDLMLEKCTILSNSSQRIKSATLKKLELEYCDVSTGYPFVISVPNLAYLRLSYVCFDDGISLCKMDSLVSAKIEDDLFSQQGQHELLCSLYNVTSLELVGFKVEGMLNAEPDKFPIFHNIRTLDLYGCFQDDLDEYELHDKLEALGSFLQTAPCLEKLILRYCMFYPHPNPEWENERKNITLHPQGGKTFQCPKLMLIEVIYDNDHAHQLIEVVWWLGRSLPNASIQLKQIEKIST